VAVRAQLPTVERWAEQVAALGLPTTLCHNDLHGNNVFDIDDELRFFDFGDALLMEPLAALTLPLTVLADALGAGPDEPGLWRVADAGLEVWSDVAPAAQLPAALPAALQLGRLGRVVTWVRCLAQMDDAELAEWGTAAGVAAGLAAGAAAARPPRRVRPGLGTPQ
jgi:Ser/Thr protein kinase RdoA (MazF antagonist)